MAECANPLLLGWVLEWLEKAREQNSKGFATYKKAYDSLKACPLPFTHPSEAQQLMGFGPKLCARLTEKFRLHYEEHGLPLPELPQKQKKKTGPNDDDAAAGPVKKTRKPKPYVPALRSGAYAIILALSTLGEDAPNGMTKAETIEEAQQYCDSSFKAPSDPTKFYTAWSSMKILKNKDYVYEKGRPVRYTLTDEGWGVAKQIKVTLNPSQGRMDISARKEKGPPNDAENSSASLRSIPPGPQASLSELPVQPHTPDTIIPEGEVIESTSSLPSVTPIVLQPGSFSVQLVLDIREIRAKQDRDYMQNELAGKGVTPIMRALELGDVLWVAKLHDKSRLSSLGAEGDEILLDWIVERKRLDDLVSSIKDGRFHEQKFRLKKSGIKNVIYIIEEIPMHAEHVGKYEEMVASAIASTQVVNGFFVKKTQTMDDTIRYLTRMTKMLKGMYEKEPLRVIPTNIITARNYLPLRLHLRQKQPLMDFYITYSAFGLLSSKSNSLTLRDVYLKFLMCTRGVTGEKALEIQKRWKTPNELIQAFERCGDGGQGKKRKMEMVSNEMGDLVGRKKIAKAVSVKISEVWGDVNV